jgi:hypothetical protein
MKPPLAIAKPCQANWDEMTGDDRRRLCAQCNQHVHNLSALTPRELKRFVEERDGTECISYVFREDGTIVIASRWAWWWSWLRPLRRGMAWMLAVLLPSMFGGCASDRGRSRTGGVVMAGTPPPPAEMKTVRMGKQRSVTAGPVIMDDVESRGKRSEAK